MIRGQGVEVSEMDLRKAETMDRGPTGHGRAGRIPGSWGFAAPGRLFALCAGLLRPDIFTRLQPQQFGLSLAGSVSGAVDTTSFGHKKRIYMDVGTNEFGRFYHKGRVSGGGRLIYRTCLQKGSPSSNLCPGPPTLVGVGCGFRIRYAGFYGLLEGCFH